VIVIDSPFANVANIARALRATGADVELSRDPETVACARKLVLPGVGSFAAAMQWLDETGLSGAIREAASRDALILGICVGHQLLFDVSVEHGRTRGLGLLRGSIERFDGALPVPQIGWNRVHGRGALFAGVQDEAFYFVNSYAARGVANEIATAQYDGPFTAAVQRERVFGVQFHPEKSSSAGLRVLRNFVRCN
jgi:imidazole glycerol-phosphate synthase subunit HisH